ncbi:MAG: outer membrane beta-barrel protein [Tannerella sp.]|jgi:hypothetical protein|nr:outer membrane beta-barrel protein [Tannerella sp.]
MNTEEALIKKPKGNLRKRFVFLSVLITMSLFRTSAKTPVSFGLKMEAGIHEFWLYDLDNVESRKGIAPSMGCFLQVDLNSAFAIQTEWSLFSRNTGIKIGGRNDHFRQWGMYLPVYLARREYINNRIWYFGIGPHVRIGFDAHMKETAEDLYIKTDGNAFMNRWDYGVSTMLGCELYSGIQFNAGLQLGFKDQLQALGKEATAVSRTFMVGIGYRF